MILISHFWSFQPFHCSLTLMNSQIQMANLFFIYSFMFSLLATFTVTSATETDIYCLKSIRDSMIDPNGYLNTTLLGLLPLMYNKWTATTINNKRIRENVICICFFLVIENSTTEAHIYIHSKLISYKILLQI
jgi:hypothetical protein